MDRPHAPAFAADVMLGKTARWLRLLGFDTFYANDAGDDFLHALAIREGRFLLTRDHGLHRRMPEGGSHLVAADRPRQQLPEIVSRFHLDRFRLPPRCSLCNGTLAAVTRDFVEARVPPFVWATQPAFSRCDGCGQLYWPGTHAARIRREIIDFLGSPPPEGSSVG